MTETCLGIVDFAEAFGVELRDHQRQSLQTAATDRWTTIEGDRQTGKTFALELIHLEAAFVRGERVLAVVNSQHEAKAALSRFERFLAESDLLRGEVRRITRAYGSQSVELRNGGMIWWHTWRGNGRGYIADLLTVDDSSNEHLTPSFAVLAPRAKRVVVATRAVADD